jgi:hypothetical protein
MRLRESIQEINAVITQNAREFEYQSHQKEYEFIELQTLLFEHENAQIEEFRQKGRLDLSVFTERLESLQFCVQSLRIYESEVEGRIQDTQLISRLEATLALNSSRLVALSEGLQECRRQIISQEGVYSVRFGMAPSVAVLRPQTASGGRALCAAVSKGQRPLTPASGAIRPHPLLKGHRSSSFA